MNKIILGISFILFFCVSNAQKFSALSSYEKRWAFFHPVAALKVKAIHKKCRPIYELAEKNNILDRFSNGGKLDAYRHVFFMAAFSQKIKPKKIRKLGKAHEKGNYKLFLKNLTENNELPDSLSTVMDLMNNEVGLNIGIANKKIGLEELNTLVINEIKKGKAIYVKRDLNGRYLKCDDEAIDLMAYKGLWSVPKCLISTDK